MSNQRRRLVGLLHRPVAAWALCVLWCAACVSWSRPAAALPSTVAVQGAVTALGGGPAPDGLYGLTFGLYKDANGGQALWTEGPLLVNVKNGQFAVQLGNKSPLANVQLGPLPAVWLGVAVNEEAELPRVQMGATMFALRSAVAGGIECSGCIDAVHLAPGLLDAFAKKEDLAQVAAAVTWDALPGKPKLAPVATSGVYSDLDGTPSLAKVATSGVYADLAGKPLFAQVATSGKYTDLSGIPSGLQAGATCGSGLVVRGFLADGGLDCVAGGKPSPTDLPADGIDEISNGLIFNQFQDSASGTANNPIKDNNPTGTSDVIDFPDIGLAQKLTVSVELVNSNLAGLKLVLFDPNNVSYELCGGAGKPACGKAGDALKTSYPDVAKPASGDLAFWVGKNPKGKWYLNVIDTDFCTAQSGCVGNQTDGKVVTWAINIQTLSNKKVQVKGQGLFDGSVQLGNDAAACTPAKAGTIRWTGKMFQGCNGKSWVSFAGLLDGTTPNNAAMSCATLHADFPDLPDGIYWLDPNGGATNDAFQAPCNMTRQGGGWTMGVKSWYQGGVAGNTGAMGSVNDALQVKGNGWKLSDQQIRDIIGADNTFDVMIDQAGYNSGYSNVNNEYIVIQNYTAAWTFGSNVKGSSTPTAMFSYRASDNALAWQGNMQCGDVGGYGINCYNMLSGPNPAGGAGCNINMGSQTSSGWHHIYMGETNTDTYLYMCNGAQHSSSYNMNHRFWFR